MQQQITNFNDDDYVKYSLIKPPEEFSKDNLKYNRLVIDSRIRDINLYPNPNNYVINFDDDITDITTAKLIYIQIPTPFTNYIVNQYFNTIAIVYNGVIYTITLVNGDYTISTLMIQLQSAFDIVLGSNAIIVSLNTNQNTYTFTSSLPFTFNFQNKTNHIATLLGFNPNINYTALHPLSYVLTSPYKINLTYNNYIIMNIDQFDILKSLNSNLDRSFAVISPQYNTLNIIDNPSYIKYFSPPIPKLSKLHIYFTDFFGNPYDFQNQDHHFEIVLTSFKQRRKYGNIFS